MPGINIGSIRPGDHITFAGATGKNTRRRVEGVGAKGIWVWYQGAAYRVPEQAMKGVEFGPEHSELS